MAEEKEQPTTLNSEDMDALRILLHNVRGLSAVSSAPAYVATNENDQE